MAGRSIATPRRITKFQSPIRSGGTSHEYGRRRHALKRTRAVTKDCRVLVVSPNALRIIEEIRQCDDTVQAMGASNHQAASALLQSLRPNVVFSVKEVGQTPESLEPIFKADFVEWVHLATTGIDHLPS